MIDQNVFDAVADHLVEVGVRVTYENLREAFRERNRAETGAEHGASHSPRDIQDPFDDWKHRRRYKPHLALHDLPGHAEKAVATSLDALRIAAGRLPLDLPPMVTEPRLAEILDRIECVAVRLEEKLDALAADNASLRRDLIALASRQPGGRVIRKGRKSGVFDSTSRHFWDRLMRVFRDHIKAEGPAPLEKLMSLVDQDSHDLAAAAFETITDTTLREKLSVRVGCENYFRLEGGLYHLRWPEPRKLKSRPIARTKRRSRIARSASVADNG